MFFKFSDDDGSVGQMSTVVVTFWNKAWKMSGFQLTLHVEYSGGPRNEGGPLMIKDFRVSFSILVRCVCFDFGTFLQTSWGKKKGHILELEPSLRL